MAPAQMPEAVAAVGVMCAPTMEEAAFLHASTRLLQLRIREGDRRPVARPEDALRILRNAGPFQMAAEEGEWPRAIVGDPAHVHRELTAMAQALGITELLVVTITHSQRARLASYALLAQAFAGARMPDPAHLQLA